MINELVYSIRYNLACMYSEDTFSLKGLLGAIFNQIFIEHSVSKQWRP